MKEALLSVFFSLWLYGAFAQQEKVIFYNSNWLITKQEHAVFARSFTMPDTVAKFRSLRGYSFNGDVTDYYSNVNSGIKTHVKHYKSCCYITFEMLNIFLQYAIYLHFKDDYLNLDEVDCEYLYHHS